MASYLHHTKLAAFTRLLQQQGAVYAPQKCQDGITRYGHLQPGDVPDLSLLRSMMPPKKYLLHPEETILTYTAANGYQEPLETSAPWFLFGVHPCDLAAIAYLDALLLTGPMDHLYANRRTNLTLIGVSCTPDRYCSCHEQRTSFPAACDLFFHQDDDGWWLTVHSDHGTALLQSLAAVIEYHEGMPKNDTKEHFTRHPEPAVTEPDWQHPGWQMLADNCLGCGACSVVCPTCSCFDIREQSRFADETIRRLRSWDNCLFGSHSEVAGGYRFARNRRERFQYRYRHKYLGFGALHGSASCTGCGRCRAFCPMKLDLRELDRQLQGTPS
jgi:ferredoxin